MTNILNSEISCCSGDKNFQLKTDIFETKFETKFVASNFSEFLEINLGLTFLMTPVDHLIKLQN